MAVSKRTQRAEVLSLLKALNPKRRRLAAADAGRRLFGTEYWKTACHILAYMPLPAELDTGEVLGRAWGEGKKTFVPRVEDGNLEFGLMSSFEDPFDTSSFGVREPMPQAEPWEARNSRETTLILVPGLAFDLRGRRLGRGGGFYDRFLSRIRSEADEAGESPPLCLGFAFEEQIFPEVPADKHDEKVDGLLSDGRFMIFTACPTGE